MEDHNNDNAPLFKKWSCWYILVIAFLILLIILFSLFNKKFA